MFGRTRPAMGLAWNPGLSEVLGGYNSGVTVACPWGGGDTWGTGTPAVGLAGGPGSSATLAVKQDFLPHITKVAKSHW